MDWVGFSLLFIGLLNFQFHFSVNTQCLRKHYKKEGGLIYHTMECYSIIMHFLHCERFKHSLMKSMLSKRCIPHGHAWNNRNYIWHMAAKSFPSNILLPLKFHLANVTFIFVHFNFIKLVGDDNDIQNQVVNVESFTLEWGSFEPLLPRDTL